MEQQSESLNEDDYDSLLGGLKDPPLHSDYLQKRVTGIINNINCEQDSSLKNSLLSLNIDEQFIQKNLTQKAKQYDYIPIAYLSQLLSNHIRHSQQKQHLLFYEQLTQDQQQLASKAYDMIGKISEYTLQFDHGRTLVNSVIKDSQRIHKENQTYHQQLSQILAQKDIVKGLYTELTFTEQEKKVLFGEDEDEDQDLGHGESKSTLDAQDEEELRFDRFRLDFFKALGKLNKMQQIVELLEKEQNGNCTLARSIKESMKFVEDNAYVKLVKHLKNKIRMFDTPLENQPEFLTFMKITLKMLKEKSQKELYSHIINELLKSRSKYIELSYQEKINLIQSQIRVLTDRQQSNIAKIVALKIAWLHEALLNELQILEHTSLDQSRYTDALNTIFTRTLAKQIKQKLEQDISSVQEFASAFELYYLIISFFQIMHDQFAIKVKISSKDDLSDIYVLSFYADLKYRSLTKLIECSDHFLSKFHNLFFSQASQTPLQLERLIQLITKIFAKLFEVINNDKKDLEMFKKRILLYAITRVLPNTNIDLAQESNIQSQNLVQLFNYFDCLSNVIPLELQKKGFKDEVELITDRIDHLSSCLKTASYKEFESKPSFNALLQSSTLDAFRQTLDDLEDELDYEDVRLMAIQGVRNEEMKQLIVEMIKEEVIGKMKEQLTELVNDEIARIQEDQNRSEEDRAKAVRQMEHLEFEIVEKIEYIKKKIS